MDNYLEINRIKKSNSVKRDIGRELDLSEVNSLPLIKNSRLAFKKGNFLKVHKKKKRRTDMKQAIKDYIRQGHASISAHSPKKRSEYASKPIIKVGKVSAAPSVSQNSKIPNIDNSQKKSSRPKERSHINHKSNASQIQSENRGKTPEEKKSVAFRVCFKSSVTCSLLLALIDQNSKDKLSQEMRVELTKGQETTLDIDDNSLEKISNDVIFHFEAKIPNKKEIRSKPLIIL